MKYLNYKLAVFTFLIFHQLISAQTVIISKDKNNQIKEWVQWINPSAKVFEFYFMNNDSQVLLIDRATHIVIGGGEDISDAVYGGSEFPGLCGKPNPYRDSIELGLIKHALQKNVPLLGICRGHQLINASTGGSLLADIDSLLHSPIQHMQVGKDSAHSVKFESSSIFYKRLSLKLYAVNSTHHQCIKKLSPLFFAAAYSPDGIIEAIQIKNKKHFAIGVQWHPERLRDIGSFKLGKEFLK
jgi:putative glutamine amidotransferase